MRAYDARQVRWGGKALPGGLCRSSWIILPRIQHATNHSQGSEDLVIQRRHWKECDRMLVDIINILDWTKGRGDNNNSCQAGMVKTRGMKVKPLNLNMLYSFGFGFEKRQKPQKCWLCSSASLCIILCPPKFHFSSISVSLGGLLK